MNRTIPFVTGLTLVFLFCLAAFANDPPHNDDSGVPCGECHGDILFKTDPDSLPPDELKDAYNDMCLRCHWSTSGSYTDNAGPLVDAHTSWVTSRNEGSYVFSTSCVDCHHPHYQSPQFWYGRKYYKSDYEIATGTGSVTGSLSNPVRTVITYNSLTLKSDWTVADLQAKTSDGRGVMLLPNRASPYNSRIVESITGDETGGTITVKGSASIAASGFAVAYGQAIKRDVPYGDANGQQVEFFDNQGRRSFAVDDGGTGTDSSPNGICQVCHTETKHFRNDGTISEYGKNTHNNNSNRYSGTNCIVCHSHTKGFSHTGPGTTECSSCHGDDGAGYVGSTETHVLHTGMGTIGDCGYCHNTSYFPLFNSGSDDNSDGVYDFTETDVCNPCHVVRPKSWKGSACTSCHSGAQNARAPVALQFTANSHHVQGPDADGEHCFQCHWEADANGRITAYHRNEGDPADPDDYINSYVDLVIYGGTSRPGLYEPGTTVLQYKAKGTREEISSLNTHCLGCHDDDTKGEDIFADGNSPDAYAWDGNSIAARFLQTETTTWGKYTSFSNTAPKNITKAYSAHGNAVNNEGGGYSTVTSCYGTDITNQTCPDLGGTWNPDNDQCDSISLSECTQNYCVSLTQQQCEEAAGTWGPNSSICKNLSQYSCATGFCYMNGGNYDDYYDYLCNDKGGTYREASNGWICTDISSGQCSGFSWVSRVGVGTWHVIDSDYMQGVDYLLRPTRGGANSESIACFDCHNSHGSSVAGSSTEVNTTSYESDTPSGGILKDTGAGQGGYSVSYKPREGGDSATKNEHKAGAALCLNCHLTASADPEAADQPWSYDGTFGASAPIIGYFDSEYLAPGGAGPQKLFPYKALGVNAGGHLEASKPLNTSPAHNIGGLCTPCHDPHGVSPTAMGTCSIPTLTDRANCVAHDGGYWGQDYGVPLLKGTWLTSPYREDAAPGSTTLAVGNSGKNVRSEPGFHIDQNTFVDWDFASEEGINEDAAVFAGLCLKCHLENDINPNEDNSWYTMDRVHNTVKGWDTDGTIKHRFSCSKCHTPHNGSALPRLMVTNCLNFQHRGRVASGGYPHSGNYTNTVDGAGGGGGGAGSGQYPGGGAGAGDGDFGPYSFKYGFGGVACHDSANSPVNWPNRHLWNQVTPWTDVDPVLPSLSTPTSSSISTVTATIGATISDLGAIFIEDHGTVWGTSSNPTGNGLGMGAAGTGAFSHQRTNLPAGRKIYYRGYATNSKGTGYSPQGSFYTEPDTQASFGSFTSIDATGMTINWTPGSGDGDGVIVLMKLGGPVDAAPSDGIWWYAANDVFGYGTQIGAGNYVVYKGSGASVNVKGLFPATTYHVAVFYYAGMMTTAGVNKGTNYNQTLGPGNRGNATTITASVVSLPFNYTGSMVTLPSLPAAAENIVFTVEGGGGGGGRWDYIGTGFGGVGPAAGQNGHTVLAAFATTGDIVGGTPQDLTLNIYVGGGGTAGGTNDEYGAAGGWGYPSSSGAGGNGEWDVDGGAYGGAGGGGSSAIVVVGTGLLVQAAGGAGGRSSDWLWEANANYMMEGGSGGAGGGSDSGGTLSPDPGGAGGSMGTGSGTTELTLPANGGDGQVIITYEMP